MIEPLSLEVLNAIRERHAHKAKKVLKLTDPMQYSERFMTFGEAARLIGTHRSSLDYAAKVRKLKFHTDVHTKRPLISEADLNRWIRDHWMKQAKKRARSKC